MVCYVSSLSRAVGLWLLCSRSKRLGDATRCRDSQPVTLSYSLVLFPAGVAYSFVRVLFHMDFGGGNTDPSTRQPHATGPALTAPPRAVGGIQGL